MVLVVNRGRCHLLMFGLPWTGRSRATTGFAARRVPVRFDAASL
jgi:hypothetical protein